MQIDVLEPAVGDAWATRRLKRGEPMNRLPARLAALLHAAELVVSKVDLDDSSTPPAARQAAVLWRVNTEWANGGIDGLLSNSAGSLIPAARDTAVALGLDGLAHIIDAITNDLFGGTFPVDQELRWAAVEGVPDDEYAAAVALNDHWPYAAVEAAITALVMDNRETFFFEPRDAAEEARALLAIGMDLIGAAVFSRDAAARRALEDALAWAEVGGTATEQDTGGKLREWWSNLLR